MAIHQCSYWSIESANWLGDADGGTLLLTPPDESALLRIDTVGAWAPAWHELIAAANLRALNAATVKETRCGSFAGLTYEVRDTDGQYCREWMLTLGELHLVVSYSCREEHRDRDRTFVDGHLSTLADRRP